MSEKLDTRTWRFCTNPEEPESVNHQMAAQLLYNTRMEPNGPYWDDLPRVDRVPFYSLTESLFG